MTERSHPSVAMRSASRQNERISMSLERTGTSFPTASSHLRWDQRCSILTGERACGIDARVLEHFGVKVIEINAELGYPEHGIDTDGIDSASGRHMLLRVARAAARERAHFGVAFDYDADRGNLVLPGLDESAIIAPQQVAAFNISLALARRQLNNEGQKKLAVVLSDATSLASERVARTFGAEVHYVETGEINVVTKMHQLRKAGYDRAGWCRRCERRNHF